MILSFDDCVTTLLYASVVPNILFGLYLSNIILWSTFKVSLVVFFIVFVVLPLIFKYSYKLQASTIFLNFVNWPKNPDYENPSNYGLDGAYNFYVTTDDKIQLGVWQILPESIANTSKSNDQVYHEEILNNGQPVIIYNHGNSGNRVAPHRVELYKVLRRHFHVIAYDYRGYGDSTHTEPTETLLVRDCINIYKWVANRTSSKLYVWGHSLGTGLSTHSLALLNKEGIQPSGLILESPFNNMRDEISLHPLASLFKNLPWFTYTVVEPMQQNKFLFESDKHIMNVDCSILILHAKDDVVVPYKLGRKLYETAVKNRKEFQGTVEFIEFESKYAYGHKFICRAPELDDIIERFITRAIQESKDIHLH